MENYTVYLDAETTTGDQVQADIVEYNRHFVDDMSGQKLDTKKIIAACKKDMNKYLQHNAQNKVPIGEAWRIS